MLKAVSLPTATELALNLAIAHTSSSKALTQSILPTKPTGAGRRPTRGRGPSRALTPIAPVSGRGMGLRRHERDWAL